ncbi:MAG TPA: HAMP domain-containing sensor histidine kinase [Candidatus Dormibacteraeota bacterium]|nr:HAMP domain-containing sensor histidine kinase [Candidatus Dormibacteraeota bacterium]
MTAPSGPARSSGKPDWWPDEEAWPPRGERRAWTGPSDWEARRREWRARRMRYGGGGYGGMRRGFGCLITLMATLVVSIGVLVLWLLGGLLGLSTNEGFLASLARPAGLVVLVVGIIALVIGIRIARSVAAPLSELVDAAGRIEAADYSVRVTEPIGGRGELRGLTRAFNEMAARLEAEDATRRRLLADVSHELRTPLAVIQGNLEALLDGVYPPDEHHIGPILDEVRVMERLVDDLRTLSLAEAGALPLHREPTDPAILLEDVAAAHRARAEAAGLAITVAVHGALPSVDVDPVRIRQVVSNLVDNAIRAMTAAAPTSDGDPAGSTIALSAGVADGRLSIEVVDDGPGIPPELLGSVFDRFAKSAESRGSGLGLSIARAIATAHGGTITAESPAAARGTRMRISLPL